MGTAPCTDGSFIGSSVAILARGWRRQESPAAETSCVDKRSEDHGVETLGFSNLIDMLSLH